MREVLNCQMKAYNNINIMYVSVNIIVIGSNLVVFINFVTWHLMRYKHITGHNKVNKYNTHLKHNVHEIMRNLPRVIRESDAGIKGTRHGVNSILSLPIPPNSIWSIPIPIPHQIQNRSILLLTYFLWRHFSQKIRQYLTLTCKTPIPKLLILIKLSIKI